MLGNVICSEGDEFVEVCAVINELPAEGLESDITVHFSINGVSPGNLL